MRVSSPPFLIKSYIVNSQLWCMYGVWWCDLVRDSKSHVHVRVEVEVQDQDQGEDVRACVRAGWFIFFTQKVSWDIIECVHTRPAYLLARLPAHLPHLPSYLTYLPTYLPSSFTFLLHLPNRLLACSRKKKTKKTNTYLINSVSSRLISSHLISSKRSINTSHPHIVLIRRYNIYPPSLRFASLRFRLDSAMLKMNPQSV